MSKKAGDHTQNVRRSQEIRLRAQLLGIEDPKQTRRLEGRSRLQAALKISQLYIKAKDRGFRRDDINERIGAALGGRGSRSFRIERWSLPFNITEITDDLISEYRNKPEPQKKASVYFRAARVLAELAGDDPQARQLELLELINLDVEASDLPDIDPSQKLADLLQAKAHNLAHRLDLASLMEKAVRVQAGWDMHRGPVAKFISDSRKRFDPRTSAFAQDWRDDSIPPYPSVRIATVPFQVWDEPFYLDCHGMPTGKFLETEGICISSWNLFLSIAPIGEHGYGAFIARSAEMHLQLQPSGDFPGFDGKFFGLIENEEIEAVGACYLNLQGLGIETADGRTWAVGIDPSEEPLLDIDLEEMIARTGKTIPLFRERVVQPLLARKFQPVTTGTVRDWLLADHTIPLSEGMAFMEIDVPGFNPHSSNAAPHTWTIEPSLARALEVALHGSELDAAFEGWTRKYRQSLEDLYADWIVRAQKAETALRRRWMADAGAGDGAKKG